jgi:uncharacterized protein (DUF1778 family)
VARKPITVRLNDEEAELQEQAAWVDAVSQNEFVRQAFLGRIAARKADPPGGGSPCGQGQPAGL